MSIDAIAELSLSTVVLNLALLVAVVGGLLMFMNRSSRKCHDRDAPAGAMAAGPGTGGAAGGGATTTTATARPPSAFRGRARRRD
ncbi:uncharacterized protein AMSG_07648 [Thecamonas trahens ATCC 50062]|uniref:Uncharacterized protein n=1 Tax=Thecamonas trahens ATCC 50062 TaxID=461836 RepID=A0A0L0DJH5_THETB|nr:hypothetical protein AMSG_07648 [Thecamonas trahens ATCC 50062]KNC51453.1 hypothetical protein AMSG_07648 [Thecamonas trahens ATCC 50062]|eukprot:XP_013756115.1 hypothetical protein AMSG_07648 [Thecamonas trahens ATCC 50062]